MSHVVTGKRTEDGSNVWRRADGTWSRSLADAGLVDSEANAKAHVAAAIQREQRVICAPYVIEVKVEDGVIQPQSSRERIRATGPTIRIRRPD
jgi:sulfite reductase (NADPH) hemoprotein beta-component